MGHQFNLFKTKVINQINIDGYLARIQCGRERIPNLKFLRKLHRSHLLNIPFENLDIHYGNQIILDVNKIYTKLIVSKRGGFCYELNGLFHQLLLQLGFNVKILSSRTFSENGELGDEFDHLFLIVFDKDKEWLIDVGFGELYSAPIQFELGLIQMDANKYFKIDAFSNNTYVLQSSSDGLSFKNEYVFSKKEHQFIEFVDKCQYHQSSPKSKFTRNKVITIATKEGRMTLTDNKFIIKKLGEKTEEPILNQDQFEVKLLQHFNIDINAN